MPYSITAVTDSYIHYTFAHHLKNIDVVQTQDVFMYDRVIVVKSSTLKTGVSKTGKKWQRWSVDSTTAFSVKRKTKTGSVMFRVYRSGGSKKSGLSDKTNQINAKSVLFEDSYQELVSLVVAMYERATKTKLPEWVSESEYVYQLLAFPMLRQIMEPERNKSAELEVDNGYLYPYKETKIAHLPLVSRAMMRGDVREFVAEGFGKTYLRKDFIKAVGSTTNLTRIGNLSIVSKLVPPDWGIKFLTESDTPESSFVMASPWVKQTIGNGRYKKKTLQRLFSAASLSERKRLMFEKGDAGQARVFDDVLRIMTDVTLFNYNLAEADINFRSWQTVHDSLLPFISTRGTPSQSIEQCGFKESLDGRSFTHQGDTFKIVSAKDTHELVGWGTQMANCIGSYGYSALSGESNLFAIYDGEGSMIANMELDENGEPVQLVGKYNSDLDDEFQDSVMDAIKKNVSRTLGS